MRAAIYARMSTDKQSETSPADQVRECRRYAERQAWAVVPGLVLEDAGISGASRHNRPALLQLVARIDEWDVLLCYDFSRLARNSEDMGWLRNRLRLHKRTAIEVSTGLDLFNVGAKVMGVLNEEYLEKLRADTRRGMVGRVERGLSAGGLPYGYRSVPVPSGNLDAHGRAIPAGFRLVVDEERAAVVRRIFAEYAAGGGYRVIAHRLNAEGLPSPRGRAWAPSALHALLQNPIYRGELVWNRSEWIKDHETGRRRRYERPESEWLRQEDPVWRIVPDELFQAAQARRRARRSPEARAKAGGRSHGRYPLSGLLECGACGGGFWAVNHRGEFGCGWRKDRGRAACESGLRVPHGELEGRIFGALRDQVLTPEVVEYAVDQAVALVRAEIEAHGAGRDRERLAELEAQIERAVELGIRTGGLEAVARRLEDLRAERAAVARRLAAAPEAPDPEALRGELAAVVGDLRAAFEGAPQEMRRAMRALLGERRLRVSENAERGFRVEGEVEVPTYDGPAGFLQTGPSREVAGAGFEPTTCGL